jgi:uncharacterized protein (TIGR03083 family)
LNTLIDFIKPVQPILTVELFPPLSRELIGVLKNLTQEDWEKSTVCAGWTVKDVAAHLLGGNLSRLSDLQEQHTQAEKNGLSFEALVRQIDQENEEWVRAARRINISLLIELLKKTDKQLYQKFKNLSMEELANTPVSWAGETASPNWMDIAREYTEKWLHQQHIREAVGRPLLTSRKWLVPVLDTFMRALPYIYRNIEAKEGMNVTVRIVGEVAEEWCLLWQDGKWRLYYGVPADKTSLVIMNQDIAWRLFTKGITPEVAQAHVLIEGDRRLGEWILQMVSIMA